jgi:hypothetical protein
MDVPAERTVATLREAFTCWGRPLRVRVDNGHPWGSRGDLPTELGLWLLGLGIDLIYNPPRQPQANGVVERWQEIGQRWADPALCADVQEVQRRIDAMDRHQREGYPEPARSRMRLFPGLAHSGRAYQAEAEASLWREDHLRRRLAEYAVVRQINARGLISVYGHNYYVGKRYAGQTAYVRFEAETGEWLFELTDGPVIGRQPAGLTWEAIVERRVTRSHHRGKPRVASSGET